MKIISAIAGVLLSFALPVFAHHSYAVFDLSKSASVDGAVAKLEWTNPHTFVWMYVRSKTGEYQLYSFENGSVSMLKRFGWTQTTFRVGERITLEYFPLKDGRNGGYFIKATHADGRVTTGDPYAPGGSDPNAFKGGGK